MKVLVKIRGKGKDRTLIHILNEKTGSARCVPWPREEAVEWEVREMVEKLFLTDANTCLTCWQRLMSARDREAAEKEKKARKIKSETIKAYNSPEAVAKRESEAWNRLIRKARNKSVEPIARKL